MNCPKCTIELDNSETMEKHFDQRHPDFPSKALSELLFHLESDLNKYEKAQTYGDSAIAISSYLRDLLRKL